VLLDPKQALETIESEQIDNLLPAGSGALASTAFLDEVWKRNPCRARFLIDSMAELDVLVRSR